MDFWQRTVLDELEVAADVSDRGFGFIGERGAEEFVPFATLVGDVRRRAAALAASGIGRGARLGIIIPGNRAFITTFLAGLVAGAVPVPMYPPMGAVRIERWMETVLGILQRACVTAVVCEPDIARLLQPALAELGTRAVTVEQLKACEDAPFHAVKASASELAFLQFTSGSTAAPRGVRVTHGNIAANCGAIVHQLLHGMHVVGASWLPLYHDMGLIGFVLAPLFGRHSVFFLDTLAFMRRPTRWFDVIHRERATVTFSPNFGYALATRCVTDRDLARWDLSCVKVLGCGAEPISAGTLRAFTERFAPTGLQRNAFRPCYGMAEATLLVTSGKVSDAWQSDVVDAEVLRDSGEAVSNDAATQRLEVVGCGAPLPGHAVRILDAQGQPVVERVVGEIEFSGPSRTEGYFSDPECTAQSYRGDRLLTGDLGYLANGELFVTGRKKELIIVNGRNYAPQSIEWSVGAVDGVRMGHAVAFAVPDPRGSEAVVLVCESNKPAAALIAAIRDRVLDDTGLTLGDVVIVRPGTLPRTSSGKLQRLKARSLYLSEALTGSRAPNDLLEGSTEGP